MASRSLLTSSWLLAFAVFAFTSPVRAAPVDDAEEVSLDLTRRPRSWLDVGGFVRSRPQLSERELGAFAALGISWDTPPRRDSGVARPVSVDATVAGALVSLPLTPRVARAAVNAALRTAKLYSEDTLDGLGSRARWSGIIPELRLRAGRQWNESARTDVLPTEDLRTSDAAQANLWVEARAIFRLDRLVFADEELAVLRLRLEQSEIAQKLASRVVSALAAWQRAWIDARAAPVGSVAALEAGLQLGEIEAALDVLTGGWFASWRAKEVR